MDDQAVERSAALLWDLWSTGERVPELPDELRPSDLDEGWAIQRAMDRLAGPLIGWKVAASSATAQAVIGVAGPLVGPLYEWQIVGDGVAMPVHSIAVAEAEFVFKMGGDLTPATAPFSRGEVVACVASAHAGIEVPDCRLLRYPEVSGPQMVADAMCGGHLVVGDPITDADFDKLGAVEVVLRRNGVEVDRGTGAEVLGDPLGALVWLANEVARKGASVLAGHVITTGACAVARGVVSGDAILATFGSDDVAVSVAFS